MKTVHKSSEPASLKDFRQAQPLATWENMRNDALHNGQQAYTDCRSTALADQHGLCAYCEQKLDVPGHCCTVEHIQPKSSTSQTHNWHLDWGNLLAVCDGGERSATPATPLPENLSCGAAKGGQAIPLTPLDIPAFPNVFSFDKGTGWLHPDQRACTIANVNPADLQASIDILQLNCERLARLRREVVHDIDRRKSILRKRNHTPQESLKILAESYLGSWSSFFTTIRCCLGQDADAYLRSINYQG